MKKRQNNSARASALQITLAVALMSVSAILLASSFNAAQSDPASDRPLPVAPAVTCGAGAIRVEATNSGNDAEYATLALAFAAINAGTHTGVINVGVCASVTDTAVATLNASGTGSASYTAVVVNPAGGAARTLDGAIAAGSPLIDLQGADNVTINGLNTGGNSLTISNTTVSTTAGTSTIRLINGASSNVITGCSVLGSSTASTTVAGGNVLISTSTGGANTGNIISNNAIGAAGVNNPTKGVMSLGSVSPNNNTLNVITGNNIFDFGQAAITTAAGVSISTNSDTTTISNNRIYQTAPRVFTVTCTYSGIFVSPGSAGSATITGNIIGFGAANGTGTTTVSGLNTLVRGINAPSTSTSVVTSIQNNTVSGINLTTGAGGTGSSSGFIGITVGATAGLFNVGGTTGNTIGSLDGSSTIVVNATTVTANSWGAVGIFDFSFQNGDIVNNNAIGAITINNGGSGTGAGFRGIRMAGTSTQSVTINNNTIGGTGAGAIVDNVVGSYNMYGIDNGTSTLTSCSGNLIRNMTGFPNAAGIIGMSGIIITALPTGASTISGNTIHSLTVDSTPNNGAIYAIYGNFPSTANIVEKNVVHSLRITSSNLAAQTAGIIAVAGTGTYRNNMVRLGVDSAGASITGGYVNYGMFDIAGTNNFYFNSVYIGGTGVVSSSNTFAFVSNVVTNTRNYLDNIFDNARSNASGAGKNYAMAVAGTTPNPAGLTSNRNDLYAPGTGGFVGLFNAVDQTTLANWQAATGQDANSISADPLFVDPNGTARPGFGADYGVDAIAAIVNLHIQAGSPCIAAGSAVAGIAFDIDGDTRNPITPDIGADERTSFTGATPTPTPTPTPTATPCGTAAPGGGITINDNLPASPYPSTINVSGMGGSITRVVVKLNGLSHTFPDDIDMLLVGPGGQTAVIMSDVGGGTDIVSMSFTLEDAAVASLSDAGPLVAGSFKPTNVVDTADVWAPPAPAAGVSSVLSVFNGTNPNGTWSLYIVDDAGVDVGTLTGWALEILTDNCAGPTATPNATPSPTPTPTPTVTPPPTVCVLPVEDMANITDLVVPKGYFMQNNSDLAVNNWFQGNTTVFPAQAGATNSYVAANFQFTSGAVGTETISGWLLTPPLTLQTGGQLSFWTRTVNAPAFPDRLEVRMSTNLTSTNVGVGSAAVGDFTNLLLTINPTLTTGGYPNVWTLYIATLPSMTTTKGRLAFRYFVTNAGPNGVNSDYIGIDTVSYDCNGGLPTPTPGPTGTPTPTPTVPPTPTPTPAPTGTPCPSPVAVLSQNFEGGLGAWTATNTSSGGTFPALVIWAAQTNPYALTGVGGGASTEVLNSGSGTQFAIGNSDAGGSGVTAFTTLTSPSFSTVGFSSLSISYKHYYRHITSAAAFLEVSTDGGTIWNLAKSYGVTTGAAAAFVPDAVDLSAYIGNANVMVRFRHSGGWFWYWAIDDVIVSTCGAATPTPTPPPLSITGTVIYCTNPALPAVPNVTMSLTGAPPAPTSVLTNGSGVYTITGLSSGSSYTVTPTKAAKPPGTSGINTSDSIAIQRHFLVLGTPLTGCRLQAADTNDPPNGVTTTDAIAAQRFFLGLTTGIAQTGRYKFSPVTRSYAPLLANQSAQDFNAIILGDAATAFVAPRPGGPEPDAAIENEIASSVAYVSIDRAGVSSSAIDAKSNLVGFQGDFTFDERVITFADNPVSNAGLTAGNWNVSANVLDGPGPIRTLRVSAFSLDGAPLSGTGVLFNLNTTNVDRAAEGTLTWASGGEPFVFIDANLNTQRPGHGAPSQR